MRPDSEQYYHYTPEFVGEVPPLLEGIGRILIATQNDRKQSALDTVLARYPLIHGGEVMHPQPYGCTGEEPDWNNAVLVSQDKVENVIDQLKGQPGPRTAIFSSDIVIWINGEPYQNLSRVQRLTKKELKQEVNRLQEAFSREAEVMWDVATSVSRPELRVTLVDRHVALFAPIESERIANDFWKDIPGALKRNTRIQLLELFGHRIIEVGTVPAQHVFDKEGEFVSGFEWASKINPRTEDQEQYISEIRDQVTGGIPFNNRQNDLFYYTPSPRQNGSWRVV